jgi:Fic family protein
MLELNANRDGAHVINYIQATNYAIHRLRELPLCNRLIRETQAVLMEGFRGQEKSPGKFRITQNLIGGEGVSLKKARFIPPHPEDMGVAMFHLEKYLNAPDTLDVLVCSALIHYQLETIHPFLDGNGRIGRLLITLLLVEQEILTTPSLYISYFLKKNRMEYYDRLTLVRTKGDYEQWIKFFLRVVSELAQNAYENIMRLAKLHDTHVARTTPWDVQGSQRFSCSHTWSAILVLRSKGLPRLCSFPTIPSQVRSNVW